MDWQPQALLQAPMFAPLRTLIARLPQTHYPNLTDLNALLHGQDIRVQAGHALRFVPQQQGKLGFESQYEPRCYLNGEVQTRAHNDHDLLNALVWLTFPRAKAAINARHYQALLSLEHVEGSSQRGAIRDTNTLMDESGVIVACADADLARMLREFEWHDLFVQHRREVMLQMGFYLFGHGLYEKAVQPYVGITGQGIILLVSADFFTLTQAQQLVQLDEQLAAYWADPENCRSTRELCPVPLLGVPGWWSENEQSDFYDNTAYFRSGRRSA